MNNNITRATVEDALAELKAERETFPKYMGSLDTSEMSGLGASRFREIQAQIDILEDLLGGPCRHTSKGKITDQCYRCDHCGGIWDHFPQKREPSQFKDFDELGAAIAKRMKEASKL